MRARAGALTSAVIFRVPVEGQARDGRRASGRRVGEVLSPMVDAAEVDTRVLHFAVGNVLINGVDSAGRPDQPGG